MCWGAWHLCKRCVHAERTIYPGQQSRRGREEETETAEAGARAGENSPRVFLLELVWQCVCPQQEELNDAVGFSRVIHAISQSVRSADRTLPQSSCLFSSVFILPLFFFWHAGETCCRPQHAAGCDAHHPPVLLSSARGACLAGLLELCCYRMENQHG